MTNPLRVVGALPVSLTLLLHYKPLRVLFYFQTF